MHIHFISFQFSPRVWVSVKNNASIELKIISFSPCCLQFVILLLSPKKTRVVHISSFTFRIGCHGRLDVQLFYDDVITKTKISRKDRLPYFHTYGAPRAELRYNDNNGDKSNIRYPFTKSSLSFRCLSTELQSILDTSCTNKHNSCTGWANGDECCKNPAYMLDYCCLACRDKGNNSLHYWSSVLHFRGSEFLQQSLFTNPIQFWILVHCLLFITKLTEAMTTSPLD